jgi:hypothetical protein
MVEDGPSGWIGGRAGVGGLGRALRYNYLDRGVVWSFHVCVSHSLDIAALRVERMGNLFTDTTNNQALMERGIIV